MEGSIQVSEQSLLQISVDLLARMAEIQKLRESIQAAEAAKRCRSQGVLRPTDTKVIEPLIGSQNARLISVGPL
jgi:hypothetical protein